MAYRYPAKTARAIKYIVENLDNVGTTQLVKLVYLADLHARALMKKPISELDYYWKNHGPFDKTFYAAVDSLEAAGQVAKKKRLFAINKEKVHIINRITPDSPGAKLSPAEHHVLDYVIRKFGRMGLTPLLNYVYSTKPMTLIERGDRLPMEVVDGELREEIGFDLEEVLEAKRRADSGQVRDASEFFDSLRSANRA